MSFVPLVLAAAADAHEIAGCIASAFQDGAVARWLVPEPAERAPVLYAYARIHVDHALRHGQVWMALDTTGVALWKTSGDPPAPDMGARLAEICGPYADRFAAVDSLFSGRLDGRRPDAPHDRLVFLAVTPLRQRAGVASALLEEHHIRLDHVGTAARLTAATEACRRLARRHGYLDDGSPVDLPDGPRMWPMRRPPSADRRFPPPV